MTHSGHRPISDSLNLLAEAAADLWRAATSAVQRIEVLVHNVDNFETLQIDAPSGTWRRAWAHVMQVNLYAPAELCKLAILYFRNKGGGASSRRTKGSSR